MTLKVRPKKWQMVLEQNRSKKLDAPVMAVDKHC